MMNSSFKQGEIGMHPISSTGEMNRDEMRQKLRNEMNRPVYTQPEQFNREYGQSQMMGGQYSKSNNYYHNQSMSQNYRDPYGYGMHQSLSRSSSGVNTLEKQQSNRDLYNSSAPLPHSVDQKFEMTQMSNEKAMNDQTQINNEYNKQIYYSQNQNAEQTNYLSKNFLSNLLNDNKNNPYERTVGKETRKLNNMIRLHNIK